MIHLIQSRELFGPPERQEELRTCWERNDRDFPHQTHPKGRPTFTALFAMCKPGMVNVIANSDLHFDDSIYQALPSSAQCFALSRWDVDAQGNATLWDMADSQDAWIVNGPKTVRAHFSMGKPGCDNALIPILQQAGMVVTNPSKTIRAYHLHNVRWRSYEQVTHPKLIKRVPPPYSFVKPAYL